MSPVRSGAAAGTLSWGASLASRAGEPGSRKRIALGLLTYCFGLAQRARAEVPGVPDYADPAVFIREAARCGAQAVQIPFGALEGTGIRRVRKLAEELGVALESTLALPLTDSDQPRLEAEMRVLQELGVTVARTVVFPGRRYEDFRNDAEYRELLASARQRLRRAEPLARQYKVRLAVENHKDQRMEERLKLLSEFDSESIGACIDVGNNLALLEDPLAVVSALLPWALTVHFKDQGVRAYGEGFLLADVPLGQGCIDLPGVIRTVRAKKPEIHFQLELITRDPLKVPVLNESYWRTLGEVKAQDLSKAWKLVRERGAREPFPMISTLSAAEKVAQERRNIEESFQYAAEHLDLLV